MEHYHIISNTHWDREWYQTHENYLARLVPLMDRLMEIMKRQPEFRFLLDGQYIMVRDYLAAKPEMTETVREFVKAGRLLCGPWYTQPLENLVSGEGLVRNLQYGLHYSEKLGRAERFSYEIDEFGHASQMPQIYRGFDIPAAMAWRGMPKGCKSVFVWRAPDGCAVHMFYSKAGYGEATALPMQENDFTEVIDGVAYTRDGLRKRVENLRNLRKRNSLSDHMLWLNGIDHSWVQPDLFAVIDKIKELYHDLDVRQSTPDEYAAAVLADYESRGLPIEEIPGELLYTVEGVLESTNSLHPVQKQTHYRAEHQLIRRTEPLTAAAWLCGMEYPAWAVTRAWEYVLENHAHDSLGCCSVDGVYEQVMARYHASLALSEQIGENALRHLMRCGGNEPAVYIFNLSAYPMKGAGKYTFEVPAGFGKAPFSLMTTDGEPVPMTVLDAPFVADVRYNPRTGHPTWGEKTRVTALLDLPEIPAYGWRKLCLHAVPPSRAKLNRPLIYHSPRPGVMENETLSVHINANGTFDLIDKRSGRLYPGQMLFEDCGDAGHCYIAEPAVFDPRVIYSAGANASVSMLYDNPQGCAYRISMTLMLPAGITADRTHRTAEERPFVITADLTLLHNAKQLDIRLKLENKSENHRLRVLFPSYLTEAEQSFGGQPFDLTYRKIHEDYDPELTSEQPYATLPMQNVCGVSHDGAGLAVAAEGIYEYECIDSPDRPLALTVLRSSDVIDLAAFAHDPDYKLKEAAVIGTLEQHLALIPYDGTTEALLEETALAVNPPFARVNRQPEDSVMTDYKEPEQCIGNVGSFVTLTGTCLALTAFKHALNGDGLILRILNSDDKEQEGAVTLHIPGKTVTSYQVTNLEERPTGEVLTVGVDGAAHFTLRAHGLLTLLVK